jgi:hypothetical protein
VNPLGVFLSVTGNHSSRDYLTRVGHHVPLLFTIPPFVPIHIPQFFGEPLFWASITSRGISDHVSLMSDSSQAHKQYSEHEQNKVPKLGKRGSLDQLCTL